MQRIVLIFLYLLPLVLTAQDVMDCNVANLNDLTVPADSYYLYGNSDLLTASNLTVEPEAQLDLKSKTGILIQEATYFQAGSNAGTWVAIGECAPVGTVEVPTAQFDLKVLQNPAQDLLVASYKLEQAAITRWTLFAADGHILHSTLPQQQPPGTYPIELDIQPLAAGLYFLQLQVDGSSVTEKLIKI
ncbi:MAG: T9SS type A sorting domain-containing protein [Phaeodactylibacter sp.]|nr:T9SS type A sorting domain-containing protein [Phaeodactylibacter sp.]